jgi:hypothetical protein
MPFVGQSARTPHALADASVVAKALAWSDITQIAKATVWAATAAVPKTGAT